MLLPFLLSAVLALPTGTIKGSVAPPANVRFAKPVEVVVFSGSYVNFYLAEVQKRVDNYWEDYRSLFIQDKQAFLHFRERAQVQALEATLARMRSEEPESISRFVHNTTNNTFEFHDVPQGECKIVALVTIGSEEFIWSDSVILKGETSEFVLLKPAP